MKMRVFFKEIWRIGTPYWKSKDWPYAWTFLTGIICFNLISVHAAVLFNEWNGVFFDAIQAKDLECFIQQLWIFSWLLIYLLIPYILGYMCNTLLTLRWRQWLTNKFMVKWLKKQNYYMITLYNKPIDNPDQRISSDISSLSSQTLSLGNTFFSSTLQFLTFSVILWTLSGNFTTTLFFLDKPTHIPGYMMWIAIIYAGAATLVVMKVGKPLITLNLIHENLEGNFRHSLVRLREKREEIAIGRHEVKEFEVFKRIFENVIYNYRNIITRNLYINTCQNLLMNSASIIPLLIAAPQYFTDAITLGVMTQVSSAFGAVERSLTVFMNNYSLIISWRASVQRLINFNLQMDYVLKSLHHSRGKVGKYLILKKVNIRSPREELLIKDISLTIKSGEWIIIKGKSGVGKSTLFRLIARNWPFYTGDIEVPKDNVAFIPQKPYLPLGKLKTIIQTSGVSIRYIHTLLSRMGLDHLIKRLNSEEDWCQVLSLGEQQRLAFVNLFIKKPKWIFLDESLASVSLSTGRDILSTLKEELPKESSLVMITHSNELDDLFYKQIKLQ
jgi:vitamin B12/bleomycin/antimicrobial peptide transport system ATP-binding/permease protein